MSARSPAMQARATAACGVASRRRRAAPAASAMSRAPSPRTATWVGGRRASRAPASPTPPCPARRGGRRRRPGVRRRRQSWIHEERASHCLRPGGPIGCPGFEVFGVSARQGRPEAALGACATWPTRLRGRGQHAVDHVHDAVRGIHVGLHDGGVVDLHLAAADAYRERLTLHRLELLAVLEPVSWSTRRARRGRSGCR